MDKNIPKRRFKEFEESGEWQKKKLGHISDIRTGSSDLKDSEKDGKYPFFVRSKVIERSNRYIFDGEAILIPGEGKLGDIYHYIEGKFDYHQRVYKISDFKYYSVNGKFVYYNLRKNFKKHALKYTVKATVDSLRLPMLTGFELLVPSIEEQEKIGDLFQKLDKLIDINREKLEKLKDSKSAYLTEMFPREGEDRPRRRFQGFVGAWEEKKFEEIFIYIRNNSLSRANLNYESGFIKNIHYGDILVKYKETLDVQNSILPYISNNYYSNKLLSSCLQNGDIVIADAAEDEIVGKCTEIYNLQDEKIVAGLHTIACRPIKRFEKWYLGYFINSNSYHDQLIGLMQGTKVESISKTSLKETYLKYPSLAEQEKIGNFFKKLDQQIEVQERKIEKLENMKKAYLAEMFV